MVRTSHPVGTTTNSYIIISVQAFLCFHRLLEFSLVPQLKHKVFHFKDLVDFICSRLQQLVPQKIHSPVNVLQ